MKFRLHKTVQFRLVAAGTFLLWNFSLSVAACELATTVKDATTDEIKTFFENEKKDVVTFVGYSGSEYEDKPAMLEKAENILNEFDSSTTIVNIGATPRA